MKQDRAFLADLLDGCKRGGWSVRSKDQGFIVSPPPNKRRPGFEAVYVWACQDHHEKIILLRRLKQAGLNVSWEEREVTTEMKANSGNFVPPNSNTITATIPEESPINRMRRKITAVADLCAEILVDCDRLEKDNERVQQLKTLLKGLGD